MQPRLNFHADALLLGLLRRALVPGELAENAELTQRRLEHLRIDETDVLSKLSPLKSDVETRRARLHEKEAELRRASADLQIFDEKHPQVVEAHNKGLHSDALQELLRQRSELVQHRQFALSDQQVLHDELQTLERQAQQHAESQRSQQALHVQLTDSLRNSAAAHTLELICRGDADSALRWLAELRQLLRGDQTVAMLIVLCELFGPSTTGAGSAADGAVRARAAMAELKTLFEQHSDPLPRVLEALIMLREGSVPGARELGLYQSAQFTQPAHFRLYQLVCVLAGMDAASSDDQYSLFSQTLTLSAQNIALSKSGSEPYLLALKPSDDLVCSVMEAVLLFAAGQTERIPTAAGLNFAVLLLPGRVGFGARLRSLFRPETQAAAGGELLQLIATLPTAAWPPVLVPLWQSALACFILLAAKEHAAPEIYQAWLTQSYDWPKHDLYWWMLSTLNEDEALLRNLTGGAQELFEVRE